MSDDYVAYLRYSNETPVTCDSDSPGAFRVYRHSALVDVALECCAIIMGETGNGTIEPWQEKRLVQEIKDRFAPGTSEGEEPITLDSLRTVLDHMKSAISSDSGSTIHRKDRRPK